MCAVCGCAHLSPMCVPVVVSVFLPARSRSIVECNRALSHLSLGVAGKFVVVAAATEKGSFKVCLFLLSFFLLSLFLLFFFSQNVF